ncbi:hypothetical protein SAMN05216559_1851 [Halomicrobium zhouii]|uniref:Uncharacterized protein n=1 Tax=Halomicrobium zhouii TaxID=767519 RepID=A0A1I6L1S8_9EURY|nr:hypothetical protein [Halomicrobium zhouii]SFR97424.1 hypothetical protein SAMN05216559_1851 [Halomicrobium zhouii]
MTAPLADLVDFSQDRDYDSLIGRHSELEKETEQLRDELADTLGSDSELEPDQVDQIRETYNNGVRTDLQALLDDGCEIETFTEAVREVHKDIQEVLDNPKAESVVEEIDSWLASTGLELLDSNEKRSLREVIISDVDTCEEAVSTAKTAHDELRGDLGKLQGDIDQLLRTAISDANAPSDLDDIGDALRLLEEGWHGDWTLDYDLDIGDELNERIWTVLIEGLKEDVDDRDGLQQVAVLVDNRHERIEEALNDIDKAWARVETQYERIPEDIEYEQSRILDLLAEELSTDPSLKSYASAIETVGDGLEALIEILQSPVEMYSTDGEPAIEELEEAASKIQTLYTEAQDCQSRALEAISVEGIESAGAELVECLERASDKRTALRSRLVGKIKTARRLKDKFDIELDEDFTDLFTSAASEKDVDTLLEYSHRYADAYIEIRTRVREQLPEPQAQLLEELLTISAASSDLSYSNIRAECEEEIEADPVETLEGLCENGLIEINVSIT